MLQASVKHLKKVFKALLSTSTKVLAPIPACATCNHIVIIAIFLSLKLHCHARKVLAPSLVNFHSIFVRYISISNYHDIKLERVLYFAW